MHLRILFLFMILVGCIQPQTNTITRTFTATTGGDGVHFGEPGSGNGSHDNDDGTDPGSDDDAGSDMGSDDDGTDSDDNDNDNDGYDDVDDCNDYDSAIHPGAVEVDNDYDDDCDGVTDEGFDGCNADEVQVIITYVAPVGATNVELSGMLEATYGGFSYADPMKTGTPVGMTVSSSGTTVTATYDTCFPSGSRLELSGSYRNGGADHWSCEYGFVRNGTMTVELFDGTNVPVDAIDNGQGGCELEAYPSI